MKKNSYVIIFAIVIITILTILGVAILSKNINEANLVNKNLHYIKAFWLAESGINSALSSLRNPSNWTIENYNFTLLESNGYCEVNITFLDSQRRNITSTGTVENIDRTIEAIALKYQAAPPDFYTNAIYSAGVVNINGNAYSINGNVTTAYNISGSTSNINGTININSSVNPLMHLNFEQLKQISQTQGNYHDAGNLSGPFPTSFFYNNTTPNIVFLEGNLILRGNDKVGGFFVVGGDVEYDATLSGNVKVNGTIYTLGSITINGGGSGLNINGGLWSGEGIRINGGVTINYNQTYMQAISNLNITSEVQLENWREVLK